MKNPAVPRAEAICTRCAFPLPEAEAGRATVGLTTLMYAAVNDHGGCVKRLVEAEADVNAVSKNNNASALMYAAFHGRERSLKALIESGADMNQRDSDGNTSLHYSAAYDHTGCMHLFISSGVSVNAVDGLGSTPLITASLYGNFRTVGLLLQAGAHVNMTNRRRATPLIASVLLTEARCKKSIEDATETYIPDNHSQSRCVELLIKAGTGVNVYDTGIDTALSHASANGLHSCVELLIQA